MPFAKGNPGGPGRPKGKPNRKTEEAKAVALSFLQRRTVEEIEALWEQAKAESASKAMSMWLTSQEFVIPKLGRTEVSGPDGEPLTINVVTLAPRGKE